MIRSSARTRSSPGPASAAISALRWIMGPPVGWVGDNHILAGGPAFVHAPRALRSKHQSPLAHIWLLTVLHSSLEGHSASKSPAPSVEASPERRACAEGRPVE